MITATKTETTKTAATAATTFGIELEFTGITQSEAVEITKAYFHSNEKVSRHVFALLVSDQQGREWAIDHDPKHQSRLRLSV